MRQLRPPKITWLVYLPDGRELIIRASSEASARLKAAAAYNVDAASIERVECLAP